MHYLTELDRDRALTLVEASLQTYNAYDPTTPACCLRKKVTPPKGYDLIDHWSGVDAVFNRDKTLEYYGLVFRSQQPPYTYIFAFRGTESALDLLDDFAFEPTEFVPRTEFTPRATKVDVPANVRVESGFFRIYCDADGETPSMQQQLFTLIETYQNSPTPISQLLVTGHSLGAALSSLFTLDLALSKPELPVANYNFASPRAGNAAFVRIFERQAPQQDPTTRTVRIQNVYDVVPCTPLNVQGYQHLPYVYLVAFHKDAKFDPDFVVDNHSVAAYKATLQCAFSSNSGVCETTALAVPGQSIPFTSMVPNPRDICSFWNVEVDLNFFASLWQKILAFFSEKTQK